MIIIDGTYLVYKSYYRTKKIQNSFGISNDIHFKRIARNMFLKLLANIKQLYKPNRLYIVFDCEGKNFRHELLPTYKSQRKEKPEELGMIKSEIYHFLELHNFPFQVAENVEGDDLIASYVHQNPNEKIKIFTGDGDMGALVSKNVTLLLEKKSKIQEITVKNFHNFFPIPPSKMPDYKALQGDRSDFIKGIDGLFRSETLHLLIEFKSLEDFFENGKDHYLYDKLTKDKQKLLVNKQVSSMKKDCPITVSYESTNLKHVYMPKKIASKVGW